ncbi:hypothetical protein ACVBE9_05900 [Eionea flava]
MSVFETNIEGNSELLAKYSTKNTLILASEKSRMTCSDVPYIRMMFFMLRKGTSTLTALIRQAQQLIRNNHQKRW